MPTPAKPSLSAEAGRSHIAGVEHARHRLVVAVEAEHRLQGLDRLAGIAPGEEAPVPDRHGRHEVPHALGREPGPGKDLARILLALGRDVGLGEHPLGRDGPARTEVARQRGHRRHLRLRVGRQAADMPGMDDLDAERAGVDVALALPGGGARVPGAAGLRNHLGDGTILEHEVMRRDLGARIAQPGDGGLRALHAGVVQDQHVGPWDGRAVGPSAAALAVVRRGQDTPRHRAVGRHRRPRSAAIRS